MVFKLMFDIEYCCVFLLIFIAYIFTMPFWCQVKPSCLLAYFGGIVNFLIGSHVILN